MFIPNLILDQKDRIVTNKINYVEERKKYIYDEIMKCGVLSDVDLKRRMRDKYHVGIDRRVIKRYITDLEKENKIKIVYINIICSIYRLKLIIIILYHIVK